MVVEMAVLGVFACITSISCLFFFPGLGNSLLYCFATYLSRLLAVRQLENVNRTSASKRKYHPLGEVKNRISCFGFKCIKKQGNAVFVYCSSSEDNRDAGFLK